ncbi:MAG: hypothetical protein KDA46_02685, partial [Parvularculaceae bacterium]|nr:hypothetical protein [Parvularculaceae bacterium]
RQLAGDNARYSQNVNAGRSQRVNVHNISASPYVNHRFANGSAAELRYRFSQVFVGDTNNNFSNSLGLNFNKDSRTQEVLASYDTGNAYDQLQVGVTAYGNKTSEYGSSVVQDFDYKQGSISGDFQYALSPRFAVTGVIGYDDVSTTAPSNFISADTLSGVNWRAGFRAQPGRKTDIALQYGERYGDGYVNANIRYDVTGRITFAANASRTVQTRAQAVSSQFEATQREILDFAERLRQGGTGDATQVIGTLSRVARTRIDAQTIGLGVANRANAGLSGVFGRTTLGLTANYSDTDFGFRQVEMYGAGLNARRDISRRTSAYGNLFVRHVDSTFDPTQCVSSPSSFGLDPTIPGFDPVIACGQLAGFNGVTTTAVVRIGASHKIYKNVSAYGEYSHTERFSKTPGLEYGENAVTAGLQMEF